MSGCSSAGWEFGESQARDLKALTGSAHEKQASAIRPFARREHTLSSSSAHTRFGVMLWREEDATRCFYHGQSA
jgi:hypothetical protein